MERSLVALIDAPGIATLARDVVPHYEREGMSASPLAEAMFAGQYPPRHPATPLRPYLHLFLAHRLRAASECPDAGRTSRGRGGLRRDYRKYLDLALADRNRLIRLTAEGMERRGFLYVAAAAEQALPRSRFARSGELKAGQSYEARFASAFLFRLEPGPPGWRIVVREAGREEDLARLTPPFHFVPNPREVEGWHFRNRDNTGPNEAGPNNVNAPGVVRDFIFSPAVGRSIAGPRASTELSAQEIEREREFGQGSLRIPDYRLTNLRGAGKAAFEWLRFEIELSWPARPAARP